jgi:putative ABC transport system permease protein
MLRIALRNLGARKLRFALTALAIVLGTAMISGTFVLTDQISGAFDDIFAKANRGVDVILTKQQAFTSDQGAAAGPLPESLVQTVAGVSGVAAAEGLVDAQGSIVVDGKFVSAQGGAPTIVVSTPKDPRFRASDIEGGRFPTAAGEIAVDVGLAKREKLKVGQKVGLSTRTGVQPVTIVGTFRFADSDAIGGATIVGITLADAQRWFDRENQVTSIVVATTPDASAEAVKQRIQQVVPADVLVETGSENADRQANTVNDNLGFLRNFLFVFGVLAMFVAFFIIFNVFSITVAQRIREMAMLRTIGASRKQLRRSVMVEALVVGIVASIIGIAIGVLFAMALKAIFNAVGFGLPTTGIVLKPRTVIWPLVVGVVVTLLAALMPAFRATRISPVAALREGATLPRSRISRFVPYIGVTLAALGVILIVLGFRSSGAVTGRLALIFFGALFVLFGVGLATRLLIRPIAAAVGWPLARVFGSSAELGRQNAIRDPARTTTTAIALMLGIGATVFLAVFVTGLKESFFDALDKTVRSDLIIISDNFQPLPVGAVDAARGAEGVDSALGVGFLEVEADGSRTTLNAVDPAGARSAVKFDWQNGGTDALLDQLGTGNAIIERGFAEDRNLAVGQSFSVTTIDNRKATYRVIGEYKDPQLFTGFTVSDAAYAQIATDRDVGVLLVGFKDGVDPATGKSNVEAALESSYPAAKVRTRAEYKDFINQQITSFLFVLYAMLALVVLISVIGVIITLLLAIHERTREIGMMRAVGAQRRQIRGIIRSESVITCAIGGLVGVGVGLFLGWVMIKGLESEGLSFSVPVTTLIAVFVLAVIVGVLAAALPARRAARLNPLDALHYE